MRKIFYKYTFFYNSRTRNPELGTRNSGFLQRLVILLFTGVLLFLHTIAYAAVSDTWSNISKKIGGDFADPGGTWANYTMPDSTADGKWVKKFWLVPGADFEYKYYININGETVWEPSFSNTTSTNREIIVQDQGGGQMVVECNWADTPSAPANLSYYALSGAVHLSWDTPTDNSKYDVVYGGHYDIYYDTGPAFDTWVKFNSDTITTTEYLASGLTNNTTYFFTVTATDAYNDTTGPLESAYADSVSAMPEARIGINFRIFVGDMIDSAAYFCYTNETGIWTETLLTKEGTTDWWSDTIPLPAAFNLSFKFAVADTDNVKTYEYPNANSKYYHFMYPAADTITKVEVQGSWNSWGAKTALTLMPDSYWQGDVYIGNGLYEYKFVLNGYSYVNDPINTETRNSNSLLHVDCLYTTAQIREMTVPDTDTTLSYDWEDTPLTVGNFKAYSYDETTSQLRWEGAAITEDLDTFYIEYTETPADTISWTTIAALDSTADSYLHQGRILGDTYYYRIYSVDYAGNQSPYKSMAYTVIKPQISLIFYVYKKEY